MCYGARLAGLPKQELSSTGPLEIIAGQPQVTLLRAVRQGNALSDASRMGQPGGQTAASAQNAV